MDYLSFLNFKMNLVILATDHPCYPLTVDFSEKSMFFYQKSIIFLINIAK
jgi:hypothetical protein